MVSYQTWVALTFRVARRKGVQYEGIADGADTIEVAAAIWSQNTETIKQWTERQALDWLEEHVAVR